MALASLQTLRDTLWEQLVVASGLPQGDVIWYTNSGIRPGQELSKLWIGINLKRTISLNENESERVYDNPSPTPGAEVIIETAGQYEFEFSIHVFSMNVSDGDGHAPYVLRKIRSFLGRQTTRYQFVKIGAPIVDRGPILHVPTVLNTKYESRANMSLRVRAAVVDVETETFIERVTGTITVDGRSTDFDTDN